MILVLSHVSPFYRGEALSFYILCFAVALISLLGAIGVGILNFRFMVFEGKERRLLIGMEVLISVLISIPSWWICETVIKQAYAVLA